MPKVSLERAVRGAARPSKTNMKRRRTGPQYASASDALLASAGGYRSYLGNVYTRDVISGKGGNSGFVDYLSALTYLDDAGLIALIPTVAQGASTQERIGRKIKWTGMDIRIRWQGGTGTGVKAENARYAIVYDSQPGGSLPAITDIYESIEVLTHRNEAGFERFRVLKEWNKKAIGNSTDGTNGNPAYAGYLRKYLKVNKEGRFKTLGTGAIGDIAKGAIYLVMFSDVTAASANASKISTRVAVRTHFKDVLA